MKTRRDVFQAIADPTRRAILLLIAAQAMTPNAIAEEFRSSRQAVSKHIQILTECELVKQEQKGHNDQLTDLRTIKSTLFLFIVQILDKNDILSLSMFLNLMDIY